MHYNTTHETGQTLTSATKKNQSLDTLIMSHFARVDTWQPSQLFNIFLQKYPITSIRRSLTDLTKEGKLIKTEQKKIGYYGRNEHVWRIKE